MLAVGEEELGDEVEGEGEAVLEDFGGEAVELGCFGEMAVVGEEGGEVEVEGY